MLTRVRRKTKIFPRPLLPEELPKLAHLNACSTKKWLFGRPKENILAEASATRHFASFVREEGHWVAICGLSLALVPYDLETMSSWRVTDFWLEARWKGCLVGANLIRFAERWVMMERPANVFWGYLPLRFSCDFEEAGWKESLGSAFITANDGLLLRLEEWMI